MANYNYGAWSNYFDSLNETMKLKFQNFEFPEHVMDAFFGNISYFNISIAYPEDFETDDFCTSRYSYYYINVTCYLPCKYEYASVMYGYIFPFFLLVTAVTNTLILAVLSRPHMWSPTNVILMAIATCDMLTALSPAPWNFYMYTLGNHYRPLGPVAVCTVWKYMTEIIPTCFHTASIWMTVALAVHQYTCVCHAPLAKKWCTMPRTVLWLVFIVLAAFLSNLPRFLMDGRFVPYITEWRGHIEEVCALEVAPWVYTISFATEYFLAYGFYVLCVQVIPCTSLVVFNILLIRAMRTAQLNRQKLFKNNRRSESQSLRDSINTTRMLIVIMVVFLTVQFPTTLPAINYAFFDIFDHDTIYKIIAFKNVSTVLFFSLNFAIYSAMSRQFRETFKGLFKKKAVNALVSKGQTQSNRTVKTGAP